MEAAGNKTHLLEGLRWLTWSAVISVLPFGLIYCARWYDGGHAWPPASDVFGAGQGLLTGIAMFAVAIKELQGPRLRRTAAADFLALLSLISLISLTAGYGYLTNDLLAQRPQSLVQQQDVAAASLVFLVAGAVTAFMATAVASKLRSETSREGL